MDSAYSINIERSVLNSVFYNPAEFDEIIKILNAEDMYLPDHKQIFKAMEILHKEEKPIDETFVRKYIDTPTIESELLEILSANPITNTMVYVSEIKEVSNKRILNQELRKLTFRCNEEEYSSARLLQELEVITEKRKQGIMTKFSPKKIGEIEDKQIEFWIKDWLPIPKNSITMLTAKGGTGKTFSAIQIAQRIAKEDSKANVLLWLSEDPLAVIKKRATDINELLKTVNAQNVEYLGNETIPFHFFEEERKLKVSESWFEFKVFAKKYDFIVLDPLIAFHGGDENSNSQGRFFMNLLNEFCIKENITILLIHHHTKDGDNTRGAGALIDAVRLHYVVSKPEDEITDSRIREFKIVKDNWFVEAELGDKKVKRKIFLKSFQQVKDKNERKVININ